MKKYKLGIILGIISIITTCTIVGVPVGDKKLAIGFLPGMILSITGLIFTKKNNEKYKIKLSLILNIIALILSIISLLMTIQHGSFIVE